MDSATIYQDSFKLYQAIVGYMTDNLFWRLTYLNAALFHSPNKEDIKKKLLSMYKKLEAILSYFYHSSPAMQELVRRMDNDNRLFVVYIDRCPSKNPAAREQTQRQWIENGNQIARLLSQLNTQWKQPEWTGMISQSIQMLSLIANQTIQGNYNCLIQNTPLCERLGVDMSEYMTKGIAEVHFK